MKIKVSCYSGYRDSETPRSYTLNDETITITSVTERWRTPEHEYFRVERADGTTCRLRRDINTDVWEVLA